MGARHTKLTLQNFSGYAVVALVIGVVAVGFGAIDLLMVGPLGVTHVAAVGQGDLILTCLLAGFGGFVDVFAAQLAAVEGAGGRRGAARSFDLTAGFLCAAAICAAIAFAVSLLIRPALVLMGQVDELIDPITAYAATRLYGAAPFLIYMAASEALKISGLRTRALHILLAGFVVNVGLNALFLYTKASELFDTPEAAVAVATVLVHVAMGVFAGLVWARQMQTALPARVWAADIRIQARKDLSLLLRTAPGISARTLNDYVGSVAPLLFIGTMNTATVAAAAVATKIYTLFCRVPQAVVAASFVYYSYGLAAREGNLGRSRRVIRTLLRYAAWPTVIALVTTLAASPWLVRFFAGSGIDVVLSWSLLLAYLLFAPLYFCEQFYGELLVAHSRAGFLFVTSTAATYLLTIPIAYSAVFWAHSAFMSILGKGVAVALLAFIYWSRFRRHASAAGNVIDA